MQIIQLTGCVVALFLCSARCHAAVTETDRQTDRDRGFRTGDNQLSLLVLHAAQNGL